MPSTKTKETVEPAPQSAIDAIIGIDDLRSLTGGLMAADGVNFTIRGKMIARIGINTIRAAFFYKRPADKAPVDQAAINILDNASCTPYKKRIDASLVSFDVNEFRTRRPRIDLIDSILDHPEIGPEMLAPAIAQFKGHIAQAALKSLVKANLGTGSGGSSGISSRIKAGMASLEETDETWDNAWITQAVGFELKWEPFTFTEDDKSNLLLLTGMLNGEPTETTEVAPINLASLI